MKKTLSLALALGLAAPELWAQVCQLPQSSAVMAGNNIRAHINQGGQLFSNGSDAGLLPTTPAGTQSAATIFAAAIWMGGVDPAGNLRLSAADYTPGFYAGPLDPATGQTSATDCGNWDKVFSVKGSRIAAFRVALQGPDLPTPTQFSDIFGWPGKDNPHFSAVNSFDLPFSPNSLAPFADANGDGRYDPLDGDYPAVVLRGKQPFVPGEMAWCVFNDEGAGAIPATDGPPMRAEVQLTAWAFDCADQPVLQNTVFTSHKITSRLTEVLDSVFVGVWVDFDLGCYTDDYLGCSPAHDCFFAYNQDALDGSSGVNCDFGISTFGDDVPVQSVAFLGGDMAKFMVAGNPTFGGQPGIGSPETAGEFYNYLTGSWRDGTPLTTGGNGYAPGGGNPLADHAFPGNPADPNAWTMCTVNLPFGDYRSVASQKISGKVLPGHVEEVNLAWTTHWSSTAYLPCGLAGTLAEVDLVRGLFEDNFSGVCSPLAAPELGGEASASPKISPNPAAESFEVLASGAAVREIRLFSADGRQALSVLNPDAAAARISVASLPLGLYFVRMATEVGVFVERLVVQH